MKLIQEQKQKQIISPQIIHTFQILQLPNIELREYLEKKLEENPFLEQISNAKEEQIKEEGQEIKSYDRDENPLWEWLDLSHPDKKTLEQYYNYRLNNLTYKRTLEDYLLDQISLFDLSDKERLIAESIIGNLNEDGYLKTDLSEIAQELNVKIEEVATVLKKVQELDPAGVAARNIEECLLIQLARKGKLNEKLRRLVIEHLQEIAYKRYCLIAKNLGITLEETKKYIDEIKKLEPKPGRNFAMEERNSTIIPDIILEKINGKYEVKINDEIIPSIKIKKEYLSHIRGNNLDSQTKQYLKRQYKEARMLIRAVKQRNNTLQKVIEELIRIQADFFEYGLEALKPLRFEDLAQRIGVNESTISRVIAGKYIKTAQGIFPLKSLFDYKFYRSTTEVQASEKVKKRIAEIIAKENPKKPLSDSQIAAILNKEGINIARRTIAKYRKQLKILPRGLRKKSS